MSHFALFHNMGECCTAGSRTYVQEEIYDKFVEMSVARAKKRIVGDPFDAKTESGPQVNYVTVPITSAFAFHLRSTLINSARFSS